MDKKELPTQTIITHIPINTAVMAAVAIVPDIPDDEETSWRFIKCEDVRFTMNDIRVMRNDYVENVREAEKMERLEKEEDILPEDEMYIFLSVPLGCVFLGLIMKCLDNEGNIVSVDRRFTMEQIHNLHDDFMIQVPAGEDYGYRYFLTDKARAMMDKQDVARQKGVW